VSVTNSYLVPVLDDEDDDDLVVSTTTTTTIAPELLCQPVERSCYCDALCDTPRRRDCCLNCLPATKISKCSWRTEITRRFPRCKDRSLDNLAPYDVQSYNFDMETMPCYRPYDEGALAADSAARNASVNASLHSVALAAPNDMYADYSVNPSLALLIENVNFLSDACGENEFCASDFTSAFVTASANTDPATESDTQNATQGIQLCDRNAGNHYENLFACYEPLQRLPNLAFQSPDAHANVDTFGPYGMKRDLRPLQDTGVIDFHAAELSNTLVVRAPYYCGKKCWKDKVVRALPRCAPGTSDPANCWTDSGVEEEDSAHVVFHGLTADNVAKVTTPFNDTNYRLKVCPGYEDAAANGAANLTYSSISFLDHPTVRICYIVDGSTNDVHIYGSWTCPAVLKSCYCDSICSMARHRDCCTRCWQPETLSGCNWHSEIQEKMPECPVPYYEVQNVSKSVPSNVTSTSTVIVANATNISNATTMQVTTTTATGPMVTMYELQTKLIYPAMPRDPHQPCHTSSGPEPKSPGTKYTDVRIKNVAYAGGCSSHGTWNKQCLDITDVEHIFNIGRCNDALAGADTVCWKYSDPLTISNDERTAIKKANGDKAYLTIELVAPYKCDIPCWKTDLTRGPYSSCNASEFEVDVGTNLTVYGGDDICYDLGNVSHSVVLHFQRPLAADYNKGTAAELMTRWLELVSSPPNAVAYDKCSTDPFIPVITGNSSNATSARLLRAIMDQFDDDAEQDEVDAGIVPVEYGAKPADASRAKLLEALQKGVESSDLESDQGDVLQRVLSGMAPGASLAGLAVEQPSYESDSLLGGVVSSMRHLLGAGPSADEFQVRAAKKS
jgi:hypothetical protein